MQGATRVAIIAAHPRWCGGVHLSHLAELVGMNPDDQRLQRAISQARRLGLIDLYRGWVIADRAALEKEKA
jgi:hypothetical protein